MLNSQSIVELRDLCVRFPVDAARGQPAGHVNALRGVSLKIRRGETLSIVGESGCGKTTLARTLLGFVDPSSGSLILGGVDISALPPPARRRALRQNTQIVFQDPQSSLDPRLRVWRIISEPIALSGGDPRYCRKRAVELAAMVGLEQVHLDRFPHELSGGQRQRVAIGRALSAEPHFLVLDEPTSVLDVSVQAQILNLLLDLQHRLSLTYLFISHDISVVRHMSDRVAVMYLGEIVELGPAAAVTERPQHPYTQMLMAAAPRIGKQFELQSFAEGDEPPSNRSAPPGCSFAPRCPQNGPGCEVSQRLTPGLLATVRCWRAASSPPNQSAQH